MNLKVKIRAFRENYELLTSYYAVYCDLVLIIIFVSLKIETAN